MPTDMTVANNIYRQIGGGSFFLIGAKNHIGDDNSLSFKVMRNARKVTHVRVELEPTDTYKVSFTRCYGYNDPVEMGSVSMVYVDQLKKVISDGTGLDLDLK